MKKIMSLLMVIIITFTLSGCMSFNYTNSTTMKTISDRSIYLDMQKTTNKYEKILTFKKGENVDFNINITSGNTKISLMTSDNTEIYSGNKLKTTQFTVEAPEDGKYTLSINVKKATGIIDIKSE